MAVCSAYAYFFAIIRCWNSLAVVLLKLLLLISRFEEGIVRC